MYYNIESDTIKFGEYDWHILEVQKDKALIVCEVIIEERAYNPSKNDTTWAECELRGYLNGAFYNTFSPHEKARIAESSIKTNDNPRVGIKGGDDVNDFIFLLSTEEIVKYFGDSGQVAAGNPNAKFWINDQYNSARIAKNSKGTASWWWLRSPGIQRNAAVYVNTGGSFNLAGHRSYNEGGGVRPALWLHI